MAAITIERTVDLDRLGRPEQAQGTLYQNEYLAHRFVIHGSRNGTTVTFDGDVTAKFIRPDGETEALTGDVENGAAVIELSQECYGISGRFTLTIFVETSGAKTAVYSMTGNVRTTTTNHEAVPSGTPVPDYSEIIDQYQDMVQATTEAENAVRVLYGEYGGDWGPSGSGVGIIYTKTGPMVKVSGSRTTTGHRFVGVSNDEIVSLQINPWNESKQAVTNARLILKASRAYIASVRFLSGNIKTVVTTARTVTFHLAEYSATAGTSDNIVLGSVTTPIDVAGLDAKDIAPMSVFITPGADVQYGFVIQDSGATNFDDFVVCFDLRDVTELISAGEKIWLGRKWAVIGDSLSAVNRYTTLHYHDYIAQKTGITVVNLAVSGSGYYAQNSGSNFGNQVANVPLDSDVVTIFGSGNDMNKGLELGEVTDTTADTICGNINITLDSLYQRLPTVRLGIITPTPWHDGSRSYTPITPGNIMEQYCDALVEICKRRSIPCLDLYHQSNLRPDDSAFQAAAYSKDTSRLGVHPDETGHLIFAPRFLEFLRTLFI